MKKMIFCSHGRLCEGMLDTLKIFSLYDSEKMKAIPFYVEGVNCEELLNQLAQTIKKDDEVIIFTDIAFGSVNQQVMLKFSDWDNVNIVAGMNLLLVLELAATDQDFSESLIEDKISVAKDSILLCKNETRYIFDEDE